MIELRVHWTDTTHRGEATKAQAMGLRPASQVSRGLLLNEEENFITIACTSSPDGDEEQCDHYRDVVCILRRQIDKVIVMEEGKEYIKKV